MCNVLYTDAIFKKRQKSQRPQRLLDSQTTRDREYTRERRRLHFIYLITTATRNPFHFAVEQGVRYILGEGVTANIFFQIAEGSSN